MFYYVCLCPRKQYAPSLFFLSERPSVFCTHTHTFPQAYIGWGILVSIHPVSYPNLIGLSAGALWSAE